jgi:hypothetical protein
LNAIISQPNEQPPIWSDPEGDTRGYEISPPYKTVPKAALKDNRLYELLAIGEDKKELKNISLGDMAEEAIKKAVARVVEEHRKTGEPLAVRLDGKVVRVPADQLRGYEEPPGSESIQARDEG